MISVVICTYNRPRRIVELLNFIENQSDLPDGIIVVDSSESVNSDLLENKAVRYIRSSHMNQPYQRYLGYTVAQSEWILFLDDDMEPMKGWYEKIVDLTQKHSDKGLIGLKFEDKHQESFLKKSPNSVLIGFNRFYFTRLLRRLSGYPVLKPGVFFKNGVKGHLPDESGWTEHTSGGAFLAQRKYLYNNFNMQLFELYDRRMGKGEDGILSYTVSKVMPLHYHAEQLFWHNDQGNSIYTQNHYRFNKVVAFSRAYLNFEYYRLNHLNSSAARLSYFNYSFWRFMGLLINFILKPSRTRWESLKGNFSGWKSGMRLKFDASLSRNAIWHERAMKDFDDSTK